jgi:hypothetical protein
MTSPHSASSLLIWDHHPPPPTFLSPARQVRRHHSAPHDVLCHPHLSAPRSCCHNADPLLVSSPRLSAQTSSSSTRRTSRRQSRWSCLKKRYARVAPDLGDWGAGVKRGLCARAYPPHPFPPTRSLPLPSPLRSCIETQTLAPWAAGCAAAVKACPRAISPFREEKKTRFPRSTFVRSSRARSV